MVIWQCLENVHRQVEGMYQELAPYESQAILLDMLIGQMLKLHWIVVELAASVHLSYWWKLQSAFSVTAGSLLHRVPPGR